MLAEHINPFINSLTTTFQTMLDCKMTRGQLTLSDSLATLYEVNGIIGLSGKAVGTVILSFEAQLAIKAASVMLMTEASEIDTDVTDAVGELTNMVAGSAKAKLEKYELSIGLPSVIVGKPMHVNFPSSVRPIVVPFTCDWGTMIMQVGLEPKEAPVAVG